MQLVFGNWVVVSHLSVFSELVFSDLGNLPFLNRVNFYFPMELSIEYSDDFGRVSDSSGYSCLAC